MVTAEQAANNVADRQQSSCALRQRGRERNQRRAEPEQEFAYPEI